MSRSPLPARPGPPSYTAGSLSLLFIMYGAAQGFSPATANALLSFCFVSLVGISVPAAFHQRFRTGYVFRGQT
ncbi:UNVERIFIED_CONTAM: hypothetical protein FKN15_020199 [Acipenser sinensis]